MTGTLACTSLADLVFILCVSVIMQKIDVDLRRAGLVTELPTSPTVLLLDIDGDDVPLTTPVIPAAWVDDLAVCMICCAERLLFSGALALTIVCGTILPSMP